MIFHNPSDHMSMFSSYFLPANSRVRQKLLNLILHRAIKLLLGDLLGLDQCNMHELNKRHFDFMNLELYKSSHKQDKLTS